MTATTGQASPHRCRAGVSRLIDPRGHRFGAALSVVAAHRRLRPGRADRGGLPDGGAGHQRLLRDPLLDPRPTVAVRRAVSSASPHRRNWSTRYPPRFAQALGFVGFSLATALFLVGLPTLAWVVAAAVGALQAVLAVTGYCLGCRLYFLKWWVPAQFHKLARRSTLA